MTISSFSCLSSKVALEKIGNRFLLGLLGKVPAGNSEQVFSKIHKILVFEPFFVPILFGELSQRT